MKISKYIYIFIFVSFLFPKKSIDKKVANLLDKMTMDEKIGQMTQVDRRFLNPQDIIDFGIGSILSGGGSVPEDNSIEGWANMYDSYQELAQQTRLKIPLIYGIDAVHGHNNVKGATIFPHNIGLGCTFDKKLVYKVADITAREVAATGIDWNFAPCLAIPQDERWGRYYEGYSEDPDLVADLGTATIKGYQNKLGKKHSIAACAKHFIGDGSTLWGTGDNDYKIDRGNAVISDEELYNKHLIPYQKAIDNGVLTVMASFNSYNGLKCHASGYLFNDLLKEELGFEGFVISDWRGIDEIPGDYKSDIITSINAGIDMVMVPGDVIWGGQDYHDFLRLFKESVLEGSISEERINDAVSRILKVKYMMGLFDNHYADRSYIDDFGSSKHRDVAREAVRKSIVLLKNEGILPLSKDVKHIHVAGLGANDIGMQCGGWTMEWQGKLGDITKGTTILEGIQSAVLNNSKVTYDINGENGQNADVGIIVIGEKPYAEGVGDRENLNLSEEDIATLKNMQKYNYPLIVIMLSGRPLMISDQINNWDAFLAAWLPGTEGDGVSDVLFGDYNPTGKLSFSWPNSISQIPHDYQDKKNPALFDYKYGLNY
ncbi:MAG: beta-glucosidase [Candidatus Marinimicrobia bacterium]|nr:beta-glucosidase [Candidatus Neomarinimicrobiota bacterium]|tara:strand:+ start:20810 stop:22609 length:1800 start_codon:yes stop_codon:yes gene_type:complete